MNNQDREWGVAMPLGRNNGVPKDNTRNGCGPDGKAYAAAAVAAIHLFVIIQKDTWNWNAYIPVSGTK